MGGSAGNRALRESLSWGEARYEAARDLLEEQGYVVRGRGFGGTLHLIGTMTAARALGEDRQEAIAVMTGLSERAVRHRLESAHGKTLVQNVFHEEWPTPDEPGALGASQASAGEAVDALGTRTVADVRSQGDEHEVATVLGLGVREVRRTISDAHGKTLIRNLFAEQWPDTADETSSDDDTDSSDEADETSFDFAGLRVHQIRGTPVVQVLAESLGLSEKTITRRLAEVHGMTLLRNVFPVIVGEDDETGSSPNAATTPKVPEASTRRKRGVTADEGNKHRRGGCREEHRLLQQALVDIGTLKDYVAKSEIRLETGFRADVVWRHAEGHIHHVFEIEFGPQQARAKSVQCLQGAWNRWRSGVFLIVPKANQEAVRRMVDPGFRQDLKIISTEECLATCKSLPKLAELLGIKGAR
jgi:AraC-like DNA-binding protein